MFFIFRRRKKTEAIGGEENLEEIKRSIAELRESIEDGEERGEEKYREEEKRVEVEHRGEEGKVKEEYRGEGKIEEVEHRGEKERVKEEYREEEELLRLAKICMDSLMNCGEADTSLRATLIELLKEIQMALCTLNNPVLRALSNILSGNADKVPASVTEELCEKGFVNRRYSVKLDGRVEASAKADLMKKLEERVVEEYELKEEWKKLITNLPVKMNLDELKKADVLPLIQAGAAELYLVPSMWDVSIWVNLKTERDVERIKSNLDEMKGVVEGLPEEFKEPFGKLVEGMISSPP